MFELQSIPKIENNIGRFIKLRGVTIIFDQKLDKYFFKKKSDMMRINDHFYDDAPIIWNSEKCCESAIINSC